MTIQKTKIEWTDMVWNPITGCSRGCTYCYARRMAYRLRGRYGYPKDKPFAVTFHPDRLHEPSQRKKPAKIFTCSMGELFDPMAEWSWIRSIFFEMLRNTHHTFQVLTKQPQNVLDEYWRIPFNCWLGITLDGRYTDSCKMLHYLLNITARVKFVSFEPLLGPIPDLDLDEIDWIIIGARTGPGAVPPRKEWVEDIIKKARLEDVPLFLKDNLHWAEQVREWPQIRR